MLILDTLIKILTARANQILIIAIRKINKDKMDVNIINSIKKKDKEKEDNLDKYID